MVKISRVYLRSRIAYGFARKCSDSSNHKKDVLNTYTQEPITSNGV